MIKIQGDIYWFTLGAKGDRTLDTATTDCCSISILPHCSVTMPQGNKSVSDHAKSAAKAIRKKIKPYSSSHLPLSTVSTASELIKAHLQSASTKKNYSSALTTARNWLKARTDEHSGDADPCSEEATSNAKNDTSVLFHHKYAQIAFEKPVEVTANLLSAYITFHVTEDHVSVYCGYHMSCFQAPLQRSVSTSTILNHFLFTLAL